MFELVKFLIFHFKFIGFSKRYKATLALQNIQKKSQHVLLITVSWDTNVQNVYYFTKVESPRALNDFFCHDVRLTTICIPFPTNRGL